MTTWKEQREWLEQLQSPKMFNISQHTQECIRAALARLDAAERLRDVAMSGEAVNAYDALCREQGEDRCPNGYAIDDTGFCCGVDHGART